MMFPAARPRIAFGPPLAAAALLVATLLGPAPVRAAPVLFEAHVEGQSDIVGVVDPAGPVVQISTAAAGTGSFGALRYFSGDQVNLGTGQGAGENRFVSDDGSELFGSFTVQLLPTADASLLELIGHVDFTGGTGRFAGATGFASFTGAGTFISPTTALSSFDFNGELLMVPEPSTSALMLSALAAAGLLRGARLRTAR